MSSQRFLQIPVEERLPQKLEIAPTLTSHSVVSDRRTLEFLPSTGSSFNFTNNSTIEFIINSDAYLDFQTTSMMCNVQITDASGLNLTCLENFYSLFRRAELLVGGTQVSTIDNLPFVAAQMVNGSASPDYYNKVLSRSGFFLGNTEMRRNGTNAGPILNLSELSGIVGQQYSVANGGMNLWADLSPVIRMFAETQSYFPARNISSIILRFYLNDPVQSVVNLRGANKGTPAGVVIAGDTPSITVSNVKLWMDAVYLTPSFTMAYDQFIQSTSTMPEGGANLLITDLTSQRATLGTGQEDDILLSKSCKYLCSVFGSLHRAADLNLKYAVKYERQKNLNLTGVQVNIGGRDFPQQRPLSRTTVLSETDKAFNRAYDLFSVSMQDYTNSIGFSAYTDTTAAYNVSQDGTDQIDINVAANGLNWYPDLYNGFVSRNVFGINTEQIISNDGSILSGVNLSGAAPAIIKLYYGSAKADGHILVACLHYKKVIKIRGNAVEVIE